VRIIWTAIYVGVLTMALLSVWWIFKAPSPRDLIPETTEREESPARVEPVVWGKDPYPVFFHWHEETKTLEIVDPEIRCCDTGMCDEVGP